MTERTAEVDRDLRRVRQGGLQRDLDVERLRREVHAAGEPRLAGDRGQQPGVKRQIAMRQARAEVQPVEARRPGGQGVPDGCLS